MDDMCENIIERYITFLLKIKNIHKNIGVYGPIPSGPNNDIQGNGRPSYKNQNERNKITKILNSHLKTNCEKNDILFKNVNNIDNNFFHQDGIHLCSKIQPILLELFSDI